MSASTTPPRNQIVVGDALKQLSAMPDASVDCVVTSPPYYSLRDYGAAGQIGLEAHVEQWVENLAAISHQAARVLVPTGTYWLNVGDTYSVHPKQGADRKSLLLAPERLVLRLQQEGWIVRNKIVWAKPNPMPTSISDRLNTTYEVIYVLASQPKYFFDLDAIRVPHLSARGASSRTGKPVRKEAWRGPNSDTVAGLASLKARGQVGHPLGKNPGDVWTITPGGYRSAHHAIYPLTLAERMIAAGCPEARCSRCRLPWKRYVIRGLGHVASRAAIAPTCDCNAAREPGLVLDPFMGSGTTAVAAEKLGRDWLGIELNPDFAEAARKRISASRPEPSTKQPKRAAA
ncbi:site-specific DNA-methyltransferase [Mycobacteroides abscessus]|uniref:DNA-methyltransferase n=1 Tax=Mycobacteroides abscessus TaxID=36809 RepID=UPI000C256B4B|nr:site-specific DNA-methyltransferase [Mycobacteroides abscessus]MDM2496000.1 site-specific DNA-methyltransferase [Mycobacteroides abscessus]MDM2514641.1 site-specific DNA-methyltransferase [Mycobacteroides abscessus]MDM2523571.1 site-specific DNA-methyltransferase [Mycobacteroides abscessus]MDM2529802.1 site-specific DNA-methyltransferase [Mycobacteroides abscessus]MDM2531345.1 site-specific DNA-methyltransferase [Mycobacteroides abscessus]